MAEAKPRWRKSSHSGGDNNCVELARFHDHIAVRDSKHPEQAPLRFTRPALAAFLTALRTGEFDRVQ